ncbi:MAG: response regulator [Acidobacteriaceae bacterium]|nr:response regulator [Acidobacteriaceae bacterium]
MSKVVVIVEDSESVASSLAIAIETIPGVRTVLTPDPRAALNLFTAAGSQISAIVTDLHLPFLDGFALIREIRSLNGYQNLPAIMITADEHATLADGSGLYRPNAIFRKPFSPKEVCRVLEHLLQQESLP